MTDRIDYEEKDEPPRILSAPSSTSAWPAVPDPRCDNPEADPEGPWVGFHVTVSDPNVDDFLKLRVVVNGVRIDGPPSERDIRPTGIEQREPLEFCLNSRNLSAPCNRVEILVAQGFPIESTYGVDPEAIDTFDKAEWTALGSTEQNPAGCFYLGMDPFEGLDAGVLP